MNAIIYKTTKQITILNTILRLRSESIQNNIHYYKIVYISINNLGHRKNEI